MKTIFTPFINSFILFMGISMFVHAHLLAFSGSPNYGLEKYHEQDVVQLSPEGDRVAYMRNGFIWVADIQNPIYTQKISIKGDIISWQWTHYHSLLVVHKTDVGIGILNVNMDEFTQTDITPFPIHSAYVLATSPKRPCTIAVSIEAKEDSQNGIYHLDLPTGNAHRITDLGEYSGSDFDSELHIKA
ncbi:MAG: hypothetical protein AB8B69_27620 [Chitinophagales bacterium]